MAQLGMERIGVSVESWKGGKEEGVGLHWNHGKKSGKGGRDWVRVESRKEEREGGRKWGELEWNHGKKGGRDGVSVES